MTVKFDSSLSQEQAVLAEVIRQSRAQKHSLGRTALGSEDNLFSQTAWCTSLLTHLTSTTTVHFAKRSGGMPRCWSLWTSVPMLADRTAALVTMSGLEFDPVRVRTSRLSSMNTPMVIHVLS